MLLYPCGDTFPDHEDGYLSLYAGITPQRNVAGWQKFANIKYELVNKDKKKNYIMSGMCMCDVLM